MDIFFAISGYLIGGHINSELTTGSFSFARFYRNRAKRILPALYAVLLVVLSIGLLLLSPREMRDLAMYAFSTTASASNIILWRTIGYFAPTADQNPLLMTWSLGVEEQFYLVVPVLLVLVAKFRRRLSFVAVLFISAVSFGVAVYQVRHSPDSAFYLLTSRAWELGVGVALAIFEVEGRRWPALQTRLANELQAWAGLILIVAPFILVTSQTPFPGAAALPSVLGATLLLSSSGAWVNERLLSWSPLVFIGRVLLLVLSGALAGAGVPARAARRHSTHRLGVARNRVLLRPGCALLLLRRTAVSLLQTGGRSAADTLCHRKLFASGCVWSDLQERWNALALSSGSYPG